MENQIKGKIYSKNQIDIATFFGGPLIAVYLILQNYKTFENTDAQKKTALIGLTLTVIFFVTLILLPDNILNIIPSIIPLVVAGYFVRTYQKKKIIEYLNNGYLQASSLGVFGKSILSLLITLILFFVIVQAKTVLMVKYNYTNYLKDYCNSSYSEKNISQDKIFVPEDASCFVFIRLKNTGYTLQQVDQVLNLEFEYQKQIGIVGGSQQTTPANSLPYDPLPFIRERQQLGISDSQITEILKVEDEYLKLIGSATN